MEPSLEDWQEQEIARKQYDRLSEAMGEAAFHEAHFERVFRFPTRVFGEAPELPELEKPTPKMTREREQAAQSAFIAKLRAQVQSQSEPEKN